LTAVQGAAGVSLASVNVNSGNCTQIRLDVAMVRATQNGRDIAVGATNDELKVVGQWQVKTGKKPVLNLDFEANKSMALAGKGAVEVGPVLRLDVCQGQHRLNTKQCRGDSPTREDGVVVSRIGGAVVL
jgi:hypothetical protein